MLLAPVLILGARAGWSGELLAALVVAGLLSDIFDGVLARRWSCDTAALRLSDSMADIVFYLGCASALWLRTPLLVHQVGALLAGVLGFETLRLAFDLAKFRRPASYHSYLAKLWGLVLASAIVLGFATQHAETALKVALALGVVCNLEGLVMSLMLPAWQRDVKTLAAAWRLRTAIRQSTPARTKPLLALLVPVLLVACSLPGYAQKSGEAIYLTGTAGLPPNTTAGFTAGSDGLLFHASVPLDIPFAGIQTIAWRKDVREHMGFFPAMFVGMVAAREHLYRMSVGYQDAAGAEQAAVFQLNRDDAIALSELLRARAPKCRVKSGCTSLYDF